MKRLLALTALSLLALSGCTSAPAAPVERVEYTPEPDPSMPAGYEYDRASGVGYKWASDSEKLTCDYGKCLTAMIYAPDGCSSLYVEASVHDAAKVSIGYTNGTLSRLDEGAYGKVQLKTFEDEAKSFKITKISCR